MTRYAIKSVTLKDGTAWPVPEGTIVDVEGPLPDPDPTPGKPHAHFDALTKDAVAWWSLREGTDFARIANGRSTGAVVYDPEQDAARITIPPGEPSLNLPDCPRLPIGPYGDGEVTIQWEVKWDGAYANETAREGVRQHKAFRVDDTRAHEQRRIELQARYQKDRGPLLTFRTYDPGANPIEDGEDQQPGGELAAYYAPVDQWVRLTLGLEAYDTGWNLTLWASDESTDPQLILSAPTGVQGEIDSFLVLFNSSQHREAGEPLTAWVRNVLVYRDTPLPLGGRPGGK